MEQQRPLTSLVLPPIFHHFSNDKANQHSMKEEWDMARIIGKVRHFEYKVYRKNVWLPGSELGNARKLLQESEAQGQAQRGGKRSRPARADDG